MNCACSYSYICCASSYILAIAIVYIATCCKYTGYKWPVHGFYLPMIHITESDIRSRS